MAKDRQKSKDLMGKLYAEFVKQKYQKYRQQFPRQRQTELMAKIIKEWEGYNQVQKEDMEKNFRQKGIIRVSPSPSTPSSKKDKQKQKRTKMERKVKRQVFSEISPDRARSPEWSSKKSAHKTPSREVREKPKISGPKPVIVPSSDSKNKESDRDNPDYLRASSQSPKSKKGSKKGSTPQDRKKDATKTKVVNLDRLRNGKYIKFFKYYYERLKQSHSNWTPIQISTIVKLLWAKRKQSSKKQKSKPIGKQEIRKRRPLTARGAFKKQKLKQGLTPVEIMAMWRQLPRQTKIMYHKLAKSWRTKIANRKQTLQSTQNILNSGKQMMDQETHDNNFVDFMNKQISI